MSFLGEQNFEHESSEKIGVLLCNLGTPDSFQANGSVTNSGNLSELLHDWI